MAVPVVLLFAGLDSLATPLIPLMFFAALVSQIPKRFVWRDRPFMAGRATQFRRDLTSSFPSRAVTCAVVYCRAAFICVTTYQQVYLGEVDFQLPLWVRGLVLTVAVLLTSLATCSGGLSLPL
eukprot:gnl/Ergobibamus_cyprinoides/3877.p1 GENE.gnl/Ergobibamus_cyprinoides/3877~~gnl/Ergobibamus_cyprinoides/3877.p1  ORF type:complete len:123 (+),score=20.99 gnl/Ergobibamus_cyprinoides/3877:317-685(+)